MSQTITISIQAVYADTGLTASLLKFLLCMHINEDFCVRLLYFWMYFRMLKLYDGVQRLCIQAKKHLDSFSFVIVENEVDQMGFGEILEFKITVCNTECFNFTLFIFSRC